VSDITTTKFSNIILINCFNEPKEEEEKMTKKGKLKRIVKERDRQIQEQATQIRSLAGQVRNVTSISSIKYPILLAILAGFFGYSPPLWFTTGIALHWLACCGCKCMRRPRDDETDAVAISRHLSIRARLRLTIFFLIFLVDFADAIVDFWTPIEDIAESYSPDGRFKGEDIDGRGIVKIRTYAIWYLLATLFGRTLGAVFAVVYQHIDESDRDLSYLLVELTILWVEDGAALLFIMLKSNFNIDWSPLDWINLCLTVACALIFIVPTLRHWRSINQGLPRLPSVVVFVFFLIIFLFITLCIILYFTDLWEFKEIFTNIFTSGLKHETDTNISGAAGNETETETITNISGAAGNETETETITNVTSADGNETEAETEKYIKHFFNESVFCATYGVGVLVHLYMLYHWGRHLRNKKIQQEKQLRDLENGDSIPVAS